MRGCAGLQFLRPVPQYSDSLSDFKLVFNPALTGLRAFIILFVVLGHAFLGWGKNNPFKGSWDMVNLFFALSGFLITSLLIEYWGKNKTLNPKKFWTDRALRLLPPVFLTCLIISIYGLVVKVPNASSRLWGEILATLFYFQDIKYALRDIPFFGFLSQSWSLSIEEQFYVLWFVALVILLKKGGKKTALVAALVGVGISWFLRTLVYAQSAQNWQFDASYPKLYYPIYMRMDSIFLGCALALLIAINPKILKLNKFKKNLLSFIFFGSVGAILWILFKQNVSDPSVYLWGLDLSSVASVVTVAYLVFCKDSPVAKILGWPGFVLFGNMSYTIYLIHWPIDIMINPSGGVLGGLFQVRRIIITVLIALVSWYLIEKPLAKWRRSKRLGNIKMQEVNVVGVAE
jgi:peptidoglycan/LPS O-acetylase OafA/YrhL